jgi:hypothetical protein
LRAIDRYNLLNEAVTTATSLKFLNLTPMNEKNKKLIGTRENEDELLNFVNYQAQEAILSPNLPGKYKDEVLDAAVGTIQKIAERKAVYYAKHGEGRISRQPHIIYEAANYEEEERENIPPVITELNENLKKDAPSDMKSFTVERISESIGISKKILYEWAESDAEFTTALGRLKDVQENDPFKTGTEEDIFVNSMMVALLLMETRDRHYKTPNK